MHFVQLLNLEDQFGEPKGILDSLTRLVEKMSGKKESLRDSVRKLQEGWKELKQAEKEMRGRLDKIPEQGEEEQEFSQEILDLAKDTWNIKDDPKKLSTDVLKRCDEIREGQDQKLRRYTWLSYVLYGIGWSLAVFGRLYGQDPLVEQG